jgi:hypothetical protein
MPLKHSKSLHNYLEYASIGMRMVFVMGISMWIGMQLDKYFEVKFPIFLSLFSLGSVIFTTYITVRKLISQLNNEKEAANRKRDSM